MSETSAAGRTIAMGSNFHRACAHPDLKPRAANAHGLRHERSESTDMIQLSQVLGSVKTEPAATAKRSTKTGLLFMKAFLLLLLLLAGQQQAVGLTLLVKPLPAGKLKALDSNVWIAKPGDSFDLDCHMEPGGNPEEKVTWLHNGLSFREGSRARIIGWLHGDQFQDFQIRFFNFSMEHRGKYVCLTSSNGNITGRIVVKPIIRAVSEKKTATVGQPVTLDCDVAGYPTPEIAWKHTASGQTWPGRQLIISASQKNDSGQYVCEGKNEVGTASATVTVDIIEPLSLTNISNPEISLRPGERLHLFCIATGEVEPLTTWRWIPQGPGAAEKILKINSSEFILPSVELKNSGTYSCTVRSSLAHVGSVGLTAHKELVRIFRVSVEDKQTKGRPCPRGKCSNALSIHSNIAMLATAYAITFTLLQI